MRRGSIRTPFGKVTEYDFSIMDTNVERFLTRTTLPTGSGRGRHRGLLAATRGDQWQLWLSAVHASGGAVVAFPAALNHNAAGTESNICPGDVAPMRVGCFRQADGGYSLGCGGEPIHWNRSSRWNRACDLPSAVAVQRFPMTGNIPFSVDGSPDSGN